MRFTRRLKNVLCIFRPCRSFRRANGSTVISPSVRRVDTISLVSRFIKMGKKVAAPKVERDEIAFYEIGSIRECRPGAFGILEPASYKAPADEKGLILLPGLAFDMSGNRLGYGGGFYDKYLKSHPDYPCAALAFELQILDEVPHEEHDKTVDYIITPERIIVCH